VLQVHASTVNDAVKAILAALPVSDLRVEEAPLEEVLADVFAKAQAATVGAATP
jgi:ABC-2 type transport system ATP-binding protein